MRESSAFRSRSERRSDPPSIFPWVMTALVALILLAAVGFANALSTTPEATAVVGPANGYDPTPAKEVLTGCLAMGEADGVFLLTDDAGDVYRVRGEALLVDHVGHRVLLDGEFKEDGEDRYFWIEGYEHLGSCDEDTGEDLAGI